MATTTKFRIINYPTSDGKPVAETDIHFEVIKDSRETLRSYFAPNLRVYVSSNLIVCYEEGDRRKHIAPDVFIVFGVPNHQRDNYLIWAEGKGLDVAIEITSKSTRTQDLKKKFELYRDVLKVPEYFLFDPREEYLSPSLQGFRLVDGEYVRIELVVGRMPSQVLGLHLERDGHNLRFYDPRTAQWVLTPNERAQIAQTENERLRRENEDLRRRLTEGNSSN